MRTNVVLRFFSGDVEQHLVLTSVFANDHAFVNLFAGIDEELAARLQPIECVTSRDSGPVAEHRPTETLGQLANPRNVPGVTLVDERRASSLCQQLATKAQQTTRRTVELQDRPTGVTGVHVRHRALPRRDRLCDYADVIVGYVDGDLFERLVTVALDDLCDDLGARYLQLVALTTHCLDQDRQLQLAATSNLDDVRRIGRSQANRDVAEDFFVETLLEVARGQVLPVLAGSRRRVDPERHRQNGLVDLEAVKCNRSQGIRQRVADLDLRKTSHNEQLAGDQLVDVDPLQTVDTHKLSKLALQDPARHSRCGLGAEYRDKLSLSQRAFHDSTDGQSTEIVRSVEIVNNRLERLRVIAARRWNRFYDRLEQRSEIVTFARHPDSADRFALTGDTRDHREVEVIEIAIIAEQVHEKVLDLNQNFVGT